MFPLTRVGVGLVASNENSNKGERDSSDRVGPSVERKRRQVEKAPAESAHRRMSGCQEIRIEGIVLIVTHERPKSLKIRIGLTVGAHRSANVLRAKDGWIPYDSGERIRSEFDVVTKELIKAAESE